jgi:hypothetical protein
MTTALTKFTENLPSIAEAGRALVENAQGSGSSVTYLKFSGKSGTYAIGRQNLPLDPEQVWVVNPYRFTLGWVCWKGRKVVGRHQWSVMQPGNAMAFADLEDHGPYNELAGEGWHEERSMEFAPLDGTSLAPHKFAVNSKSGCNTLEDLQHSIGVLMQAQDEAHFPLICFDMEQFEAQGQVNWKPLLPVQTWVSAKTLELYEAEELSYDDVVEGRTAPKKKGKAGAPKARVARPKAQAGL